MFAQAAENQCHAHWFCSLHQTQLVEIAITCCLAEFKLVPRMYSLALLLQNGGLFHRLRNFHVRCIVRDRLVISQSAPPLDARDYIREIAHYMVVNYHLFAVSEDRRNRRNHHWLIGVSSDEDQLLDDLSNVDIFGEFQIKIKHKGLEDFMAGLRDLVAVLNGRWWLPGIWHHCPGINCCADGKKTTVDRVHRATSRTVFRHAPTRPAVNKWTKLGPCVDVLLFGVLLHNILPAAFASLKVPVSQRKREDHDEDADYWAEFDFIALQGKRYAAALKMLQDAGAAVAMIVLAIVLEPLRSVTCWFMAKAREATDECKPPGVLDLLNAPYSCIVHARQYLASLLSGSSSRLILLWRHSGCNNVGVFPYFSYCQNDAKYGIYTKILIHIDFLTINFKLTMTLVIIIQIC